MAGQVRKLEHLLAEAIEHGCTDVVTGGAVHSNHARATALAARQLGLIPHLVLASPAAPTTGGQAAGAGMDNMLLSRLAAESITLVPPSESLRDAVRARGAALAAAGVRVQTIPLGGSAARGLWGYIDCFAEIERQARGLGLTDAVVACGTGGTAAALALAAHLSGSPLRIHAAIVFGISAIFHRHVARMAAALGVDADTPLPMLRFAEAAGRGYGLATPSELAFAAAIARETGIALDPVYTAKAAAAIPRLTRAGGRVLFVHTGGMFGLTRDMLA